MNRKAFFLDPRVCDRPPDEIAELVDAYWFSKRVHDGQERMSGERFWEHPRRVVLLLLAYGHTRTETLVAAFIHDVLEDTFTPPRLFLRIFGSMVWIRARLLSKTIPAIDQLTGRIDGYLNKEMKDYYAEIRAADIHVRLVKVADRLDNTIDYAMFTRDKLERYIDEILTYILPIARETCPLMTKDLEGRVAEMQRCLETMPL